MGTVICVHQSGLRMLWYIVGGILLLVVGAIAFVLYRGMQIIT
jgi:hypothetical protein